MLVICVQTCTIEKKPPHRTELWFGRGAEIMETAEEAAKTTQVTLSLPRCNTTLFNTKSVSILPTADPAEHQYLAVWAALRSDDVTR